MTLIVNLYGGPGTGKSTTAAALFALLKQRGHNAELVQEFAKEWAWEGRPIRAVDQFRLFGEQSAREARLWGKADVVVTDSPLLLGAFFARHFKAHHLADVLESAVQAVAVEASKAGVQYRHVVLTRSKAYNPAGRYQTEEEARAMDEPIADLLCRAFGVTNVVRWDTTGTTALADAIESWLR